MKGISKIILITICSMLFIGCSGTAGEVSSDPTTIIKEYMNAPTISEKSKYILHPDDEKAKMEKYYNNYNFSQQNLQFEFIEGPKGENYKVYDATITYPDYTSITKEFLLIKDDKDGKYKIDWDTTELYNDMSWTEFKTSKEKQPTKFKVKVTLDDYYNYEFNNKEDQYWSINLDAVTNENSPQNDYYIDLHGYVKKDSDEGKLLYDYLKDGKTKYMILELKYPNKNKSDSNCVEISSIISTCLTEEKLVEQQNNE